MAADLKSARPSSLRSLPQLLLNFQFYLIDFGLQAEWHFFATSHGKSACDGVRGTVKRLLAKASLQRPYSDAVLSTDAIMTFCEANVPKIKFFNVKPERYEACKKKLQS